MGLSTVTCARSIMDALNGVSGKVSDLGDEVVSLDAIAAMPKDYDVAWATSYDAYALAGVIPGADVPVSDPSIIQSWFRNAMDGGFGTDFQAILPSFAQMFTDYWSSVYVGGPETGSAPAHGGTEVLSVTSDAASKQPAFKAAILAYIAEYGSNLTTPYFEPFLNKIEEVVKTIIWTITEMLPGPPPAPGSFSENIS